MFLISMDLEDNLIKKGEINKEQNRKPTTIANPRYGEREQTRTAGLFA
jgi:hypothetical protein